MNKKIDVLMATISYLALTLAIVHAALCGWSVLYKNPFTLLLVILAALPIGVLSAVSIYFSAFSLLPSLNPKKNSGAFKISLAALIILILSTFFAIRSSDKFPGWCC